jgi:1-acyl-sn-glycerol-3-phosphate acyltransferase
MHSDSLVSLARSTPRERVQRGLIKTCVRSLIHASYRFRVRGMEHIPSRGPAIVVCNHVSFIDWVFVAVALPRLPHFVMHHHHWKMPIFRRFFDLHRVIPIAPRRDDPERLERAMRMIDQALADGELVMLFPEGTMTPDGELSEFRPGIERIVARRPVPVVPLALRGLWGSFFSRDGGEPMKHRPRLARSTVEVIAGPPIAPESFSMREVAARIGALRGAVR